MLYKHIKSGDLYRVLSTDVMSKGEENEGWVMVLYKPEHSNHLYVRKKADFNNAFVLV